MHLRKINLSRFDFRLLEAQQERKQAASAPELADSFDLPLVVGS
ncbi:MAG: hypothetical protein WA140_10250 [Geobacteraceae bacterium]